MWAEQASGWACKVTTKINSLSNAYDVCVSCFTINNNQTTALNIGTSAGALKFCSGCCAVRSFVVSYNVIRTDACCVKHVESGEMEGVYNETSWIFNHSYIGCAGMCFQICDSTGHVQYFSDSTKGSGVIKYKAKTILKEVG